jgi:excinuclease ABC subunit C
MTGSGGVVIYVGKSKRIRTRLLGYFRAKRGQKGWRIIREASSVEWEYVPSEFASLLKELELIKRLRPPYNVQRKRDALYSFLKLSAGPAPRLHVVRRVNDEPGSYFGPFRGGERIAEAVRELNDVLQLRDCQKGTPIHFADQSDLFGVERSPLCPRQELQLCLAPCAGGCTEGEYRERVGRARKFLNGDGEGPVRELEGRMIEAAERLQFELAASLRNRLQRLQMLRTEFLDLRATIQQLSFLYAVPGVDGDHRVYAIRSGYVRAVYPAPETAAQRRGLLEVARDHYRQPEPPGEIPSRQRIDEMLLVAHWFRTRPEELERVHRPGAWSKLPLSRKLEELAVA